MTKINKFDLTDAEIDALYLFTADQTVSVQDKRIVRRFARNIAKYLEEWQVDAPVARIKRQICQHLNTVTQRTGDGTPVEFCRDCGTNRLAPQGEGA